jgi:hypothetical protein
MSLLSVSPTRRHEVRRVSVDADPVPESGRNLTSTASPRVNAPQLYTFGTDATSPAVRCFGPENRAPPRAPSLEACHARRRSCRRPAKRDRTRLRAADGASLGRLRAPTHGRSRRATPPPCRAAGQTAARRGQAPPRAPAGGERTGSSRGAAFAVFDEERGQLLNAIELVQEAAQEIRRQAFWLRGEADVRRRERDQAAT